MESKRIKRMKKKSDAASDKKIQSYQNCEFQKILLKFLVIGDFGVGKTAIVRRYIEGTFSSNYKVTVGADFSTKTLNYGGHTRLNVQLWDIAGQERFGYMTRVYYKYSVAAALVFDITRLATFYAVSKWLEDLRQKVTLKDGSPIPVILLATKCDIDGTHVDKDLINKFCKENAIKAWFATSAKDDVQINEAMQFLIEQCIGKAPKESTRDSVILSETVSCEKTTKTERMFGCCEF